MTRTRRLTQLVAFAAIAAAAASCSPGAPKLYPVTGKVLFEDKPAEGALVVLHGTDPAAPKPSGTAGPDGTFKLTTYPHGDGAPAGDYVVLVTWYPPNARDLDNPQNKLPGRYADAAQSGLKATVHAGPTVLETFQLKK